jgi:TPP-dependent pyruvate/acetoin dehydrogenase alpha subunit
VESATVGQLLDLYAGMVRNRLHDLTLKRWVRQGILSKAWLGTGEEAATIGPVHALERGGRGGDVALPMIRNAGACHEMGMPVAAMLRGYLGTPDSPTRGRDLHVGDLKYGVVAPISGMGSNAPVAAGYALAFRLRGERRVALTWIGDGATKTGECHEGLNFAAVQKLPAVFVLQNNQVALGTPLRDHHAADDFFGWSRMYGISALAADGNHVLDTWIAAGIAVERCRAGAGPVCLLVETFRMGGHATHDEREARALFPEDVFRFWGRRDPIGCYEEWLATSAIDLSAPAETTIADARAGDAAERVEVNRRALEAIETRVQEELDRAEVEALASRERPHPPRDESTTDVTAAL